MAAAVDAVDSVAAVGTAVVAPVGAIAGKRPHPQLIPQGLPSYDGNPCVVPATLSLPLTRCYEHGLGWPVTAKGMTL